MAKTIKFNLVCDGCQVRTLEDLRNHFSIEDILQYYRDKVLEKWLTVRGYTKELQALQSIKSNSPLTIIQELVSIFNIETDKDKIEYATLIINYREQRVLATLKHKEQFEQSTKIYDKYFERYYQLKDDIKNNPCDKTKIQAAIDEIVNQYFTIFSMDYRNLFYEIKDISPLALLCLLMNKKTRKFYIFDGDVPSNDYIRNKDCQDMYSIIWDYFKKPENIKELIKKTGGCIVLKADNTEGYSVTMSEKECMIIRMGQYCKVSENKMNPDLLADSDINSKFPIIKSLAYRSNSSYDIELFYIEV